VSWSTAIEANTATAVELRLLLAAATEAFERLRPQDRKTLLNAVAGEQREQSRAERNRVALHVHRAPTSPGETGGLVGLVPLVEMAADDIGPTGGLVAGTRRQGVRRPGHGRCRYCASDPGVQEPIDCNEQATASATPSTSGTSVGAGGATIGVQIPFQVCLGPAGSPGCTGSSPNLAQTGVVIGALTPISGPTGSAGAAYQVSSVQVWLNGSLVFSRAGLPLGGGYVNYALPSLSTPSLGPSGTCVTGSICVGGMLGVTGATETVTLVLPTGTSSYPVTIPTRCLINFGGPC
jgi:hypothetical protein